MTDDERGRSPRFVATVMMAVVGAVFFSIFLLEDVGETGLVASELPWALVLRYVLAMGLGGGLAGWLLAGLFGRGGVSGWVLALVGCALATMVAGLFGSAVGLLPDMLADGWETSDLIAIGFGLAVLPLAFAGQPLVLAAWLALTILTHLWVRRARRR